MEFLNNGIVLEIPPGCFPLSTDSIVLADFTALPRQASVLDLGSGCFSLGLLLCANDSGCHITGVELDPAAHNAALDNIARNHLAHRCISICADLRTVPSATYDLCISNPPYFTGGPASKHSPQARRDDTCSIAELFAAAARSLKYGGDFCLVHKPERLAQLCAAAVHVGLEPKRLRLLRHRANSPVSLILLSCRKGAKPGILWEERTLFNPDNTPTDYYKILYNMHASKTFNNN